MRKMRLFKREVTDIAELLDIVDSCDTVRLGMSDEDGMFIVPVNFGYEWKDTEGKGQLLLYFHCAGEGRKVEALDRNPEIAFEMDCGHEVIRGDFSCAYSFAYRSIMGNGTAKLLTEKSEKVHGLEKLMEHMAGMERFAFGESAVERVRVYRIEVKEFTGKKRSA